jgi:4-hydroxy-4-methyl-2-oxoglutarate aldolase
LGVIVPSSPRTPRLKLPGIIPRDRIRTVDIRRPAAALVARFQQLEDVAGLVSRALDQLGLAGAIPAYVLAPIAPGQRLAGPAITVRNVPDRFVPYRKWERRDPSGMGERESYFVARPGDVIVIDGGGRTDASNLGAHSARAARQMGCAGAVVDGLVTGVAGIVASGYPVWSRGATTITGNHRVETMEVNGVICCGGAQVRPGDLVVADDQGTAIVPVEFVPQIWKICAEQEKAARTSPGSRRPTAREMKRFIEGVTRRP